MAYGDIDLIRDNVGMPVLRLNKPEKTAFFAATDLTGEQPAVLNRRFTISKCKVAVHPDVVWLAQQQGRSVIELLEDSEREFVAEASKARAFYESVTGINFQAVTTRNEAAA